MGNNNKRKHFNFRHAIIVGIGTFFIAVFINLTSAILLKNVTLLLAFIFLWIIILTGILFDIIGISAAAADEVPFHAIASKKVFGARQSLNIIRNADKVANFCNDVVGDICGTVSGAIGAAIVFRIVSLNYNINEVVLGISMTGLIAAATVSGKALGKSFAINSANEIVFWVGRTLAWVESSLGISFWKNNNSRLKKGRR